MSTSTPHLRAATPRDSELVFRVKKEALGPYIEQTWGWDEDVQRSFHEKDYDPGATTIICLAGGEVGWLQIQRTVEAICIQAIYILPRYQCRGVGSAVLREILDEASEKKLPVTLQVLKVNPRARTLYERMGFVVEGETDTHHAMRWSPLD